MTAPRQADASAHRLLDMLVEEVSLVDRAANEHRFLIVKRETPMADDIESTAEDVAQRSTQEAATTTDNAPAKPEATLSAETAESTTTDESIVATATAALEGLTRTVELLSSSDAPVVNAQLTSLATELKATADALLVGVGAEPAATSELDTETVLDAGAEESNKPDSTESAPDTVMEHLAAVQTALAQLASLTSRRVSTVAPGLAKPAPGSTKPAAAASAAPAAPAALTATLTAMSESFRTLSNAVREQHQRLGRVEKQFGLPNSGPSAESVREVEPAPVGWPMDLNRPVDRHSVDKSVSFHDV